MQRPSPTGGGCVGPTRRREPVRCAGNHHGHADDHELLVSIQTLDGLRGSGSWKPQDTRRVFHAWSYFLELAMRLEDADTSSESQKSHLLVLESRVLSCVRRFVDTHYKRPSQTNSASGRWKFPTCPQNNDRDCIGTVLRTVMICFIYLLCRHKTTVVLVVRSGLHSVLIDEVKSVGSDQPRADGGQISTNNDLCDARDLLVGVDPFDWATRALCASLKREGAPCAVFILPIGPRSLSHLLKQHQIPVNESQELSIVLQGPQSPLAKPGGQGLMKKTHRLPSIFKFSTRSDQEDDPNHQCMVCTPRFDSVPWHTAAQPSSRLHFAVRALVLSHLLLPSSTPERKVFVKDGGIDALKYIKSSPQLSSTSAAVVTLDTAEGQEVREESTPTSDGVPEIGQVIREMAIAGLMLDTVDQPSSPTSKPQMGPAQSAHRSPLQAKLQAVSDQSRQRMAQQHRLELARQHALERAAIRQRVQELLRTAMETRQHLVHSLQVMTTGRSHPAASSQSTEEWLESFLTIDKKEQLRKEQEEMRQRRLLELQYLIEERRRRERDERAMMERNDYDIPDTHEKSNEEAKREEFKRVQQELHDLQAREDEIRRQHNEHDAIQRRREAAVGEAKRMQLLLEESRRQNHENDLMAKEDNFYALKIVREKQLRDDQARQAKLVDPIAEQKKRIERMRQQDEERKRVERELDAMRKEDLLSRQRRFVEAELRKQQVDRERKACRQMEAEERWLRQQWKKIDDAAERARQEQEKQRRAEERRTRREQEQYWKAWQAAWTTAYDMSGNLYYYNNMTGESQWTSPFDTITYTATTDSASTWQDTSSTLQTQWWSYQ